MSIYLKPAYGREYENHWQAKKDWEDGKDFKTPVNVKGEYTSIRDVEYLYENYGAILITYREEHHLLVYDPDEKSIKPML